MDPEAELWKHRKQTFGKNLDTGSNPGRGLQKRDFSGAHCPLCALQPRHMFGASSSERYSGGEGWQLTRGHASEPGYAD